MDPKHLQRLARETDEQHREAMRTLHDDLAEVHFGTSSPDLVQSRRRFLTRAATSTTAVAFGSTALTLPILAGTAAAQETTGTATKGSAAPGTTAAGPTTTAAPGTALPTADAQLVRFAESVERAAVAAYEAAAGTRLFTPAEEELLRLFARHHGEHAEAHLGILNNDKVAAKTYEKKPAAANARLLSEVQRKLQDAVATTGGDAAVKKAVLRVAYDLEEGAAATYLLALGALETQSVAGAAATILPVEGQHATVLGQILELSVSAFLPSFQSDAAQLSPSAYALG